jgi:hypothetical protein
MGGCATSRMVIEWRPGLDPCKEDQEAGPVRNHRPGLRITGPTCGLRVELHTAFPARLPTSCKLIRNPVLARIVAQKLKELWSPERIAGWLKYAYSDDENYQVSHETIHRSRFLPWGLEKGTVAAPQAIPGDASIAQSHAEDG